MAAPRQFRRKPPWKRDSGPAYSIFRTAGSARIDFRYTPERVQAVKATKGARFSPDDKSWSVPLELLGEILARPGFSGESVVNALGPREVEVLDTPTAFGLLKQDPFALAEQAIAALPLELVVRLNAEKRRLRVLPRVGSKAEKIVRKVRGALYSSVDSAYSVPTVELPQLLKKLRDEQLLFAVDSIAGAALAGSSALRRKILETPEGWSADDLAAALLTPFVTEVLSSAEGFRPCFFTAEQFKAAFVAPGRASKKGLLSLDGRGLLALSALRGSLPFPIYFTRESASYVAQRRAALLSEAQEQSGPLDDVAADVLEVPLLFKTLSSGRGALLLRLAPDSELRGVFVDALSECLSTKYAKGQEQICAEVPDSLLPVLVTEISRLCEVHGLSSVPRSASFERLLAECEGRTRLRERCAYFAGLEDVACEELTGLEAEEAHRLFPHQRSAVQFLIETPYSFLADDMGLGKTLSVLSAYAALRRTDGYQLLLVVCPNSLVRNWLREAAMWFPQLRAAAISGDKNQKAWALRLLSSGSSEQEVVIVNYEGVRLPYVTSELRRITSERRTLLCLDESQRVKNHAAKTFKAITEIAPGCARRVLLSGTPTPKDVSDLWAQVKILDNGERFGKSFYRWLAKVAELGTEFSDFAVKKWHDAEVEEAILRAQELMLRRKKEKVISLPAKTFSLREVELLGSQRERYEEIRESLMLRMRSLSGEQFVREITNILEEYLRAVQIASNPRLIDPEWKGEPAKFLELDEIVSEVVRERGEKIVVWTNYLGNVRELCQRYADLGAAPFSGEVPPSERERTVRAFQEADSPKILVAVPAAGGVGITLTAAQTAVYIDKTWNAEHWMQSVDRIHRIGQRGTVNVISLLGCKVDEIIHWNLRRKEQKQAVVLGDVERPERSGLEQGDGISREALLEALEAWGGGQ